MKKFLFLLLILLAVNTFSQQTKKSIKALKISEKPKIDGLLNEDFWSKTDNAQNFVMFEPGDGTPERPDKKTIVKVAYDDEAIYVGAILYDDKPQEIPMQFGSRDDIGIVDFFIIDINPNNDGQNDTLFAILSTGAQADAKVFSGQEDFSWNAVWDSHVTLNQDSWIVEVKVPYSALRFSNTNTQTWGINFHRKINKLDEQYVWNYVDKKSGSYTQYSGLLTGIENITPPTRLSFSPYASATFSSFDGSKESDFNFGMDLKYGINESFTLDATLIPDFGQTAFDNQVLNLGPFEQQYDEKRSFFTEGTELFSKGNLFYSRRIGNTPSLFGEVEGNLATDEEIINNPSKVNMLNAIKLSGRTKSGLGVGIFNAITEKTEATIRNTSTQEIRKETTEPLANYNVLVLDQQFNKNSSISLVNSNVLRSGNFRDANVTALLFDISDKGNKFNTSGSIKVSNINENNENTDGYSGYLTVGETHGNLQYQIGHFRSDKNYNINDLGYQRENNYANYWSEVSYRIFEPTKTFNNYRISLESFIGYQNEPYTFSRNNFELDAFFVTLKRFAFGAGIETNIGNQYDFYEPRVEGKFYKHPARFFSRGWFSTDYRNKFALDLRTYYGTEYGTDSEVYGIRFSPRYRFSNKFELIYTFDVDRSFNEKGWVNELDNGNIIFGNRNKKEITNSLRSKLNFNTKSALSLSFRHYWSPVQYNNYYQLNEEGTLTGISYTENHDINYNIWNLDLSYAWEFAPGSQFVALYRNSIFNSDTLSELNFNKNLNNLFKEPMNNIVSLKFIYYIDYNNLKTWL